MQTVLLVLTIAAMLATLGVLAAGLLGVARGQEGTSANRLMRLRVLLQFVALILFGLLLLSLR
jgi:hypothetical protein